MIENIKAIQKTLQSTSIAIKTLMESGEFKNNNDAFVTMRACLKALRDRLETGEAFHLGSQLPALLHLNGHDDLNLDRVVPVTMKCILDIIDQGEAVQVLHNIPKDIRDLCP